MFFVVANFAGLGSTVCRAGDINNDGYQDFLIGKSSGANGIVIVVFGNSTLRHLTGNIIAEDAGNSFGFTISGANPTDDIGQVNMIFSATVD